MECSTINVYITELSAVAITHNYAKLANEKSRSNKILECFVCLFVFCWFFFCADLLRISECPFKCLRIIGYQ